MAAYRMICTDCDRTWMFDPSSTSSEPQWTCECGPEDEDGWTVVYEAPDEMLLNNGEFRGGFAAFFTDAKFRTNGSIIVTLTLPRESREAVMQLSDHQGYALNVAVWEQEVPDEDDLVKMLGLEVDD